MSSNPLSDQVEQFKRDLQLRNGTVEQGLIILFAYATEASPQRPGLQVYLDTMLGPPKQMEHIGKLDYKLLELKRTPSGMLHARVGLSAEQVRVVDSVLAGTHPLGVIQPDDKFDFSTGKEICYLSFHFEDGSVMTVDVERQLNFIGVGCYLSLDINLIDSLPPIGSQKTILGDYFLSVTDESELPEGAPRPHTHAITIEQLP
jgi:hypothetical protein